MDARLARGQTGRSKRVRLCILSDTHGELDARILEVAAGCDRVIHAGDIGSAAVLAMLAATGRPLTAVRGNNDLAAKWPPADQAAVQALPEHAFVDLPGGRLAVEHGHRANPAAQRHTRLRLRHPDARVVVYGHSHRMIIDQQGAPWVLNPGAAGRSRTFGGPSCLILVAAPEGWRVTGHRFAAMRRGQ